MLYTQAHRLFTSCKQYVAHTIMLGKKCNKGQTDSIVGNTGFGVKRSINKW